MQVHKLGRRHAHLSSLYSQPHTIHWLPQKDVSHPPLKRTPVTWEVYTQEQITIPVNGTKTLSLGLGVMMSKGMVLASLKQELKYKKCCLLNETILESVDDIIITIQNNSDTPVEIERNTPFCYVHYMI